MTIPTRLANSLSPLTRSGTARGGERIASTSTLERRVAHDAGQDGPLDVPELLVDVLQLLFEATSGLALCGPERLQVPVHAGDQVTPAPSPKKP